MGSDWYSFLPRAISGVLQERYDRRNQRRKKIRRRKWKKYL